MAYQAGFSGIDFSFIGKKGKNFNAYITAIQSMESDDYERMKKIILRGLKLSAKKVF